MLKQQLAVTLSSLLASEFNPCALQPEMAKGLTIKQGFPYFAGQSLKRWALQTAVQTFFVETDPSLHCEPLP